MAHLGSTPNVRDAANTGLWDVCRLPEQYVLKARHAGLPLRGRVAFHAYPSPCPLLGTGMECPF